MNNKLRFRLLIIFIMACMLPMLFLTVCLINSNKQLFQTMLLERHIQVVQRLAIEINYSNSTEHDSIIRKFIRQGIGKTGYVFVVSNAGKIIYHSFNEKKKIDLDTPLVKQAILSKLFVGSMEYTDNKGVLKIGAFAPIGQGETILVITQSKDEAYISMNITRKWSWVFAIVVIFISGVIFFGISIRLLWEKP